MRICAWIWLALVLIHVCFRLTMVPVVAFGADILCGRIAGLTEPQKKICSKSPQAVAAAGEGARLARAECQFQFRHHRWNCTSLGGLYSVFGHVVPVGSREAAVAYSIWSAGIAYSVTQACSRGNITACGCDTKKRGVPMGKAGQLANWKWGGCSVDVGYGIQFAKRFVDARELEQDARSLMNLHNNKVGRKAVHVNLKLECKCHGVSGSCTLKTCWQSLPPFRRIGDYLQTKYLESKPVSMSRSKKLPQKYTLKLRKSHRHFGKISDTDLVYLESSPNYCEANPAKGSLGVSGRRCNRTLEGPGGCNSLCCGRGYNTYQYTRLWQCQCKFHWCCHVTCNTCKERAEEYYCK